MTEYSPIQAALTGLDEILALIDAGDTRAATNAYEDWAFQFEHRIVDVGGTAHLHHQSRRYRRRNRKDNR